MKQFNTQQALILHILRDKQWHCSSEIRRHFITDYRSQIHKLRRKGFNILSILCDNDCGRKHNPSAHIHRWKLTKNS